MGIELGVALHWTEDIDVEETTAFIEEIEELGYDQIWVSNEKFFWDMNTVAAVVARQTHKVKIGTFVSDPYSVHPALSAMFINTLDRISGGRAILGLGAGGTGFPVMGMKRTKPAVAIQEAVHVIRGLLKGETVDFQGQVIQCKRGRLNVRSRGDIPIIVATRGDLVFRVGGAVADGVMISTYAEPQGIGYAISEIAKGAELAGRSLSDLTLISRVDTCISEDRQLAINAVKPMLSVSLWNSYPDRVFVHRVGLEVPAEVEEIIAKRDYNLMVENAHLIPDEFAEKYCWAGTAEEVARKVADVVRLGVDNITFLPHPPAGGTIHETVRAFARVVKPMVNELLKK
ncbi:MAG: LLM class flavin-dependent oxidoreductase [Anaerolineaceae bacterium]|nr:LLM class flavin-dependent oxidoreductase [Anaerolineaceae bacterium]